MSILCGNCSSRGNEVHHETVADVRACFEHARGEDTTVPAPNGVPLCVHPEHQPDPWAGMPKPKDWRRDDEGRPRWYGNGGKALPFPPGRYAILTPGHGEEGKLHFFLIDAPTEGRWSGYVFIKEQASDTMYPVKGERGIQVIEWIAENAREAMLRYGREIGKCGHCGRTLTDEESRAYGIGPICRNKVRFVGYEASARG